MNAVCLSVTAQAATRETLQPVQLGNESVRFDRGDYIIDSVGQRAAVQVRSVPTAHDSVAFIVEVLNTGTEPVNLDVSNVHFDGAREPVRVLTRSEMVQKAERHAGWSKFLTLAAGSLSAAALATQRDYYHVTTATPYGIYTTQITAPCYSCQAAASATVVLTGARVAQIQRVLDDTRIALGEQAFQLTTIYPGHSYGGYVRLSRFKHDFVSQLQMSVTIGEERFNFGFRFAPDGTPTPQYRTTPVAQPIHAVTYAVVPSPSVSAVPIISAPSVLPTMQSRPLLPAPASARLVASAGGDDKWHRYYRTLLESGISKTEARTMANEEFGAID